MKKASALQFAFQGDRLKKKIRQRKQAVQERSRATIEVLLEATLQLLLRQGYHGFTTTKVAERAGVSVGTLYQYFPDKDSLVMALKVRHFELMLSSVEGAATLARGLAFSEGVRAMMRSLLLVKREHLALILAMREPIAALGGDSFVREAARQLVGVTRFLIEAAYPRLGDASLIARVVVSSAEGAISMAVYEEPALLCQPGFEDELVALIVGYVEARVAALGCSDGHVR